MFKQKKGYWLSIQILWLVCFLFFISCNKSEPLPVKNETSQLEKISVLDIDFNSEQDENSILLYLQMQEEFALTLKQFNLLFQNHLQRSGLKKRIESGEIPHDNIIIMKQSLQYFFHSNISIPNFFIKKVCEILKFIFHQKISKKESPKIC